MSCCDNQNLGLFLSFARFKTEAFWFTQRWFDLGRLMANNPHKSRCLCIYSWSQVVSACSLKWGFSSQPEIEVGSPWWAHQTLATRPVGSDRALALWLCRRIPTKYSESSESIFRREKEYSTRGHSTWTDSERESCTPVASLLWGISSKFSLANHFGWPGSESIFDIAQDPPLWEHSSFSQDGLHRQSLWVVSIS